MMENIPSSVQRCIKASAKDIADSMKETGGVRNVDIRAIAISLEGFMLGMVRSAFPATKSAWIDRSAAPVAPEDEAAVKVRQEKEIFHNWVQQNATKEMYEQHIGAVDALANVLRQQYDNDETGQFAKNFPDLSTMLRDGAPAAPMSTDKPAAKPESFGSNPVEPAGGGDIQGDLGALLDEKLDEAGSGIPKEEGHEGPEKGKKKEGKPEESPEGYTGGIFDKPGKGPAAAGKPVPKRQNMDEFNTPVEELAKEKPEAATGHKI